MAIDDLESLLNLSRAFAGSQALFSALRVELFDYLEKEPSDVLQIATKLSLQHDRVAAMLDLLLTLGLLSREKNGVFSNTLIAQRYLLKSSPETLYEYIRWKDHTFARWANALQALQSASSSIYPTGIYSYLNQSGEYPGFHRALQQVEQGFSNGVMECLGNVCPQGAFRVADLGCGSGHISCRLLDEYRLATAVLADLNIEEATAMASLSPVSNRVRIERMNIVSEPLPQAEIVLLVQVLSDWPDSVVLEMLHKLGSSMTKGTYIILGEYLAADESCSLNRALLQFILAMETAGRLRSISWWESRLAEVGFHVKTRTSDEQAVILAQRR